LRKTRLFNKIDMTPQDTKPDIAQVNSVPSTDPSEKTLAMARNKIRENKYIFYGIPVAVMLVVFAGIMFILLPVSQYYLKSRTDNALLDKNLETVTKSVANLNQAVSQQNLIENYNTVLTQYIPEEPKLGDMLNLIQTKAKDFNLESKIGTSDSSTNTTVGNLAKKDEKANAIFESITSGEIKFKPKSLNQDVDAVLLSIEVSISGDKTQFLEFIKEMQTVSPVVNLVFVEYSESNLSSTSNDIVALLRFESYALKLDNTTVVIVEPKKYTDTDKDLYRSMSVEKFEWDEEIGDKIQAMSPSSSSN
jgi:Tfp pilus assembly protein PilO